MAWVDPEAVPRAERVRWRLAATWRIVGWPLVGIAALGAIALGFTGYRTYYRAHEIQKSPSDLAYQSIQLFVFETNEVPRGDAPWQLEIARVLAPAVTAVALVAAAAVVFRKEMDELRLRRRRSHVIVCGAGERGACMAMKLVRAGDRVVAIERSDDAPSLSELRRHRVLVVTGDAREADVLRRAGIARASHVVAMTGADDVNAEVVIRSGQLVSARQGAPLTCLVDIEDPDLCALLRAHELAGSGRAGYRPGFFHLYERGARMMLDEFPPFPTDDATTPHLLVIGLNPLGRRLVVEAVRRWAPRAAEGRGLVITAVDPDAEDILAALGARFERLEAVARLRPIASEVLPLRADWIAEVTGAAAPAVYVCVDDGSVALEAALQACRRPGIGAATVVAQMHGAAGLAGLLDQTSMLGRSRVFDLLDRALDADLLVGGTYELLARAIHDGYRTQRLNEGADPASDPALAPWDRLPETLKGSNRSQAAHIGVKLAAIGCGIVPLVDWGAQVPTFTEPEIELLAELEHERWLDERLQEGWRPGPRDPHARTSPYLVPWGSLSEDVRELDREAVRAIPTLLSDAGYQLVRGPGPAPADPRHRRLAAVPAASGRTASRPRTTGDYGATWKAG